MFPMSFKAGIDKTKQNKNIHGLKKSLTRGEDSRQLPMKGLQHKLLDAGTWLLLAFAAENHL